MKFWLIFFLVFSGVVFSKQGKHQLVCFDEITSKKLIVTVEGVYTEIFKETATVSTSKSIYNPPNQKILSRTNNARLEKFELEKVGTEEQYLKLLQIDLGQSGEILVESKSAFDLASLKSSFRYFYFPTKVFVQCSYSFVLDPKPISGGN